MGPKSLSSILRRAASLFAASGAKAQAEATATVAETLGRADDASIDEFVARSAAAIEPLNLDELAPPRIVEMLNAARRDQTETAAILHAMGARSIDKDKALRVAELFIGAKVVGPKTKPNALKAIQKKIADRAYLDSKDAMNKEVTPW